MALLALSSRADSIPLADLGTKATAQYHGNGLAITATPDGALLHCTFQKLEAQATPTGLWLDSTAANGNDRFQVVAQALGRAQALEPLASSGQVLTSDKLVRLVRPQVTEEYAVGVDGVQQDFVIATKPAGSGELWIALVVSGARAENSVQGVQLVLEGSSRKIAYGKLQATDAAGHILKATLTAAADHRLVVTVDDAQAVYPVRVDPTFSDANWVSISTSPGAFGVGEAMAITSDASGNIYIGGAGGIDNVVFSGVGMWNGTNWLRVGGGLSSTVLALTSDGTNIYAGGNFTYATNSGTVLTVNHIAKWNGTNWSAFGGGVNKAVDALAISGANLYAGGTFTYATNSGVGTFVGGMAQWNGSVWVTMGGGFNNTVLAVTTLGTNVYVGGEFTSATNSGTGTPVSYIAQWNGSTWSAVGGGVNNSVYALCPYGTNLCAGGEFTSVTNAGVAASIDGIAEWNGSIWSEIGTGYPEGYTLALCSDGTNLYAGNGLHLVEQWNGSTWTTPGGGAGGTTLFGASGRVYALAMSGTNLLMGGTFAEAGGSGVSDLAEWNGSSWSSLGSGYGLNGPVTAAVICGSTLYVAGEFIVIGNTNLGSIAQWNGTTWLPVGGGLGSGGPYIVIEALATDGANVYAGGGFYNATNSGTALRVNYIAKWNGVQWSALGGGLSGSVSALAVSGANVYAGGTFNYATNSGVAVVANDIAQWNGTSWTALGGGLNSQPQTLALLGTNLYAGGSFTYATNSGTGVNIPYIAQWNGTMWAPVGGGVSGSVTAMVPAYGTNLYVGGGFSHITNSGVAAAVDNIAQWNGSVWAGMNGGPSAADPTALAVSGPYLLVGTESPGTYYQTNGATKTSPDNGLLVWDGQTWTTNGSGLGAGSVSALAASADGTDLYIGGSFVSAGTNTFSAFIVEYTNFPGAPSVFAPVITSTNMAGGIYGNAFTYTVTVSNSPVIYGVSGLPSGLSVNFTNGVISGTPSQSGNYMPTISVTNPGGYGTLTLNLAVTQANLTVSGLLASNMVYNGTTNASLNFSGASLQGLAFSDPVTLNPTAYTASFPAPDVGNNLAVTVSSLTLNGTTSTNYTLTLPTGLTADITPAPVTVSLNTSEQAYDGTAKFVSPATSVSGLPVTITYNGSSTVPFATGAYTVIATISNPDYSGSTTNNLYIVGPPNILTAVTTNLVTDQFIFTWTAVPGATYQVLNVPDLSQTWLDLNGPVTATNSIMVTTDPLVPTNRFYSVQAVLQ